MNTINKSTKLNYVSVIGYVLFAVTVIACSAWIIYKYYLISGWNLWSWIETDQPYDKVIKNNLTKTVIIVSLVAGSIGNGKKSKALLLTMCYLYTLSMSWVVPTIWHIHLDFTPINEALEYVIVYSSIFSILIIPSFEISSFIIWCAKKLIGLTKNVSKRA